MSNAWPLGQQHLQLRVGIAQKRWTSTLLSRPKTTLIFCRRERLKLLLHTSSLVPLAAALNSNFVFGEKNVTAGGRAHFFAANFWHGLSPENIYKMFKRASVSRTGAVRVERDLNLRKTRASHHLGKC